MPEWIGMDLLQGFFEIEELILRAILTIPAIALAFFAIKTSRTPQGAVGWIVFMIAYPFLGVPAYLLFGFANYAKFAERRRASDRRVGEQDADQPAPATPDDRLAVFSRLSNNPVTDGNAMHLLIDGTQTFDALFAAIERAEHYVLVQFYTIQDDEIGGRLRDVLVAKAQQGVPCYVLHDELPFIGLPRRYWRALDDAGVHNARPKGPKRALGPFQWNYRNHRKLIIVDGTHAYTGGLNCSKTYIGKSKIGAWRDTFAAFQGPVVDQLENSFAADWLWATGNDMRDLLRPAPTDAGGMRAVALPMGPTDRLNTGNLYFVALAQRARKRLWIATPYFVPDSDVLAALQLAALRGVDLKIIVPNVIDHYLPYWAAYSYFDAIREAGGEVWRYAPAFTHQKIALVDDDLFSVGSVNLDIRSGLLNFELTVMGKTARPPRRWKKC